MPSQGPIVEMQFGSQGAHRFPVDPARLLAAFRPPEALVQPARLLDAAIAAPGDFPAFELAVVPEDQVTLILDRETVFGAQMVAAVIQRFVHRGVRPADITILQPASTSELDPRRELDADTRAAVKQVRHDPDAADGLSYLAATAGGERVYLNQLVTNADFVMTIGSTAYESEWGLRGGDSVIYPGLSSREAQEQLLRIGHAELTPEDERPLRSVADEVAWLLGNPVTLQSIPGRRGGVAQFLSGTSAHVLDRARPYLADAWRLMVPRRAACVVAGLDSQTHDEPWSQLLRAAKNAARVLEREGQLVLLAELDVPPPDVLLRAATLHHRDETRAFIQSLSLAAERMLVTEYLNLSSQFRVFLGGTGASRWAVDVGWEPLGSAADANRLVADARSVTIVEGAQYVFAAVEGKAS